MPMKKAMQNWLKRHRIAFNTEEAHYLCNKLELDEEKQDGCYMLVADLEAGRIDNGEFTVGLATLMGKEPEEVIGVLRKVKPSHKDDLAIACYNALANHGIAVHYTILAKMVRHYYKPEVTDQQVLSCLSRNKDLFRRLEDYPGSYFLAGKKEGQTYPKIGELDDSKKD